MSVDLKDIQKQMYEKLKPSGWGDVLKAFIMGDEFLDILKVLWDESQEGQRFTPGLKQVLRAFEECPYNKLKVVIMGQDPYPTADVADGIAFSCGNTKDVQPTLRYMFKEIEHTVYKGAYAWEKDLTRWSNQGVLMLNVALTTQVGIMGRHYLLWRPFIAYVLDRLAFNHMGLAYVFMGTKAKDWSKSIPNNNYKFVTTHPATASNNTPEVWDSGNVFNQVNVVLQEQHGVEIEW